MGLIPARDDDVIDQIALLLRRVDELERLGASRWGKPPTVGWASLAAPIQNTTPQPTISGYTDLTGMVIGATSVGGRRWKISFCGQVLQATAPGEVEIALCTGGSGAGTQLMSSSIPLAAGQYAQLVGWYIDTPSAGAVQYHLRARTTGGTVTMNSSATQPTQLTLEDDGV